MSSEEVTKVVNLKHESYDVYIGRGSIWGNPFSHLDKSKAEFKVPSRKEAIEAYKSYLLNNPELLSKLDELKGKKLGCFCKPLDCHGDFLVELIEEQQLYEY